MVVLDTASFSGDSLLDQIEQNSTDNRVQNIKIDRAYFDCILHQKVGQVDASLGSMKRNFRQFNPQASGRGGGFFSGAKI
jgi:hypothetical protein